jgi:hypothetical protein
LEIDGTTVDMFWLKIGFEIKTVRLLVFIFGGRFLKGSLDGEELEVLI